MKKSYKKRSRKIKGGQQTVPIRNLNNLFLNRNYKLAITKDEKEEMYNVKYTRLSLGQRNRRNRNYTREFKDVSNGDVFKMHDSNFNTGSQSNSWKLYVSSISPRQTSTSTSTSSHDTSYDDGPKPEGGSKKKRSRKRSTKNKRKSRRKKRKSRKKRIRKGRRKKGGN